MKTRRLLLSFGLSVVIFGGLLGLFYLLMSPRKLPAYTHKDEIVGVDEKYDMFHKSEDFATIIRNAQSSWETERVLERVVENLRSYPGYEEVEISELAYDWNDYYLAPVLTVDKLVNGEFSADGLYYHSIVVPIYHGDRVVSSFLIEYLRTNKHAGYYAVNQHDNLWGHGYNDDGTSESIFEFVKTKDDVARLVKEKYGVDTEVSAQYLLLSTRGSPGVQEDNLYIETNKGICVFVSVTSYSRFDKVENNTLYTLDEYREQIQKAIHTDVKKDNSVMLIWTLAISLVLFLIIFSIVYAVVNLVCMEKRLRKEFKARNNLPTP